MQLFKTFISIHKNIKVRPTKYFFILILAIVSLFIQAYMHNYNIVYIMMFFLVSVAGTSTLFGMLNLHPLEITFLSHGRLFATQEGEITLLARNTSSYALYDLHFSYAKSKQTLSTLKGHESKALSFSTLFSQRGKHPLQKLYVLSLFPLIHERKMRTYLLEKELIVYPKPNGVSLIKQLAQKKQQSGDLDDFKGITRFIDGENISSIHWASLAKSDTLMSKRFLYTQSQEKLHFSFRDLQGDTEDRLSQLTLWVLEASELGFDFTLELGGRSYDSAKEDLDAILTQLALY